MRLLLGLVIASCVCICAIRGSLDASYVGTYRAGGGMTTVAADQRTTQLNVSDNALADYESSNDVKDVIVVGCGLSGCAAAFYLKKRGMDILVAEAADEVGGNMISKSGDGFLWEEGPNSFQPSPTFLRFVKDLDMVDQLVFADGKLPRFVFWNEKLHQLPSKISEISSFSLLSGMYMLCIVSYSIYTENVAFLELIFQIRLGKAKVRAGLGLLGFVRRKPKHEESIMEFVERHLGTYPFYFCHY